MKHIFGKLAVVIVVVGLGCGKGTTSDEGTSSEVATSVVSGALNNSAGSQVAVNLPMKKSKLENLMDFMNPIGMAWAASWSCTGGTLTPTFNGPGSYAYAPLSCSITWGNGKTASAKWSGTFALAYGMSCDSQHPWMEHQATGCTLTRTTAVGGNSRTLTGPDGNAYDIDHDTNGAGTGWDSTVSPAPTNNGVVVTCGTGGCNSSRTLVINGSHLTGTVTPSGGTADKIWDHTVSTGTNPINVTSSNGQRTVNGTVNVQHNLAKYTATVTFAGVTYGEMGCCFPTAGSVTANYVNGTNKTKTETLTFSPICGEATLTNSSGVTSPFTLKHCL